MTEELKPCPFCGEAPKKSADNTGVRIQCVNDECIGPKTTAEWLDDATYQWNKRPEVGAPAQRSDVNDLIKMLDLHVDGVRHYLHLQIGKPLSKHLISAPEIALDNLHREMKAALAAPPAEATPGSAVLKQADELHDLGFEGGWKAAIDECRKIAEDMTHKHSSPTGDAYTCGAWDQGVRIVGKLTLLASGAGRRSPAANDAELMAGVANLGVKEVADCWEMLEHHGFPPEAMGWPHVSLAGRLPHAINNAISCLVEQREELLRQRSQPEITNKPEPRG